MHYFSPQLLKWRTLFQMLIHCTLQIVILRYEHCTLWTTPQWQETSHKQLPAMSALLHQRHILIDGRIYCQVYSFLSGELGFLVIPSRFVHELCLNNRLITTTLRRMPFLWYWLLLIWDDLLCQINNLDCNRSPP